MGDELNIYVVCYDITVTKFRNRLVKILEGYGSRYQYSVFKCHISKQKKAELEAKIEEYFLWKKNIEEKDEKIALQSISDSVCIFMLCRQCKGKIISFGTDMHIDDDFVVL